MPCFVIFWILAFYKSCEVSFKKKARRDHNKVAHELVQHGRRSVSSAVWLAGAPSCIEHLMVEDCNSTPV